MDVCNGSRETQKKLQYVERTCELDGKNSAACPDPESLYLKYGCHSFSFKMSHQ